MLQTCCNWHNSVSTKNNNRFSVLDPKAKEEKKPTTNNPNTSLILLLSLQDVTGSKASLIKDGTPRKKGKKKKGKKAGEGQGDADDFGDSFLASELQDIREDVVGMDTKEDVEKGKAMPYHTSGVILQSQPIDKIFFETNSTCN
jgi:hypothetical protein